MSATETLLQDLANAARRRNLTLSGVARELGCSPNILYSYYRLRKPRRPSTLAQYALRAWILGVRLNN